MKMLACACDVFRGDVIKVDGRRYTVVDDMSNNNGFFVAKSDKGYLTKLNTLEIEEIIERENKNFTYI